jgi:hypothetical protein
VGLEGVGVGFHETKGWDEDVSWRL